MSTKPTHSLRHLASFMVIVRILLIRAAYCNGFTKYICNNYSLLLFYFLSLYNYRAHMNIRDLQYLVALADHGHFGLAAEACFVSQPALSMQLKKLENSLGIQLVERTNKSVLLTATGRLITEQARDILARVDDMKETARQASDPLSGPLHIGIIPTLAPYLLPRIIPGLTHAFPRLSLYLLEDQTQRLLNRLKEGKLDCALIALPFDHNNDFATIPLFTEEFRLAVSANHSFADRKVISFTDLKNKKLLLLEEGHCLRDNALAVCHQSEASEAKGFNATSLETLRHMVAANIGITLIPELACKTNDGVSYLPFTHPKPTRVIGLAWRATSVKKELFNQLADKIKVEMTNTLGIKLEAALQAS